VHGRGEVCIMVKRRSRLDAYVCGNGVKV